MKHILLVEDNREIARNLTLLLRGEGYAVSAAETQARAVELGAAQQFDLALVDLNLPDGSGYAVCTALQQAGGVPVIFLTASGDEASVVTGLNMGAVDYVTKPFRPRELAAFRRRCAAPAAPRSFSRAACWKWTPTAALSASPDGRCRSRRWNTACSQLIPRRASWPSCKVS